MKIFITEQAMTAMQALAQSNLRAQSEPQPNGWFIKLKDETVARLIREQQPGETASDVILRIMSPKQ